MIPFKHILVATDFSPTAQRAVETAVALAKHSGASLTLLHITEIPTYAYAGVSAAPIDLLGPVLEAAEQALSHALAELQIQMPGASSMLRPGDASDGVVAAAEETRADLVVIGTHGRRGVRHLLMGSVAEKVVRASLVPVLTVRGVA